MSPPVRRVARPDTPTRGQHPRAVPRLACPAVRAARGQVGTAGQASSGTTNWGRRVPGNRVRLCGPILALLAISAFAVARGAAPDADVAVLVEPGMVRYGGTPALPANRVVAALAEAGIRADKLTAKQAADPGRLNPKRCTVLVVAYGNAFPLPAFENLRAFHRAGGCLVLNGVPFCHPCERDDKGGWRDLGHRDHFGHGPEGIGTGGFAGPSQREGDLVIPAGNVLKLPSNVLPRSTARPQWLDTSSLTKEDEVLPLIELRTPGEPPRPAAALIRHRCKSFRGARDVWIGQAVGQFTREDRYAAAQLVARGIAWCLLEKGKITRDQFALILQRLGKRPRPKPLPDQLNAYDRPRPWGDTFLPTSKALARELLVVDVRALSKDERLALVCLQGLTSRTEPVLWLNFTDADQFWLDWHKQKGHIDGYRKVADWASLFRRFRGAYEGAVVPDGSLYRGTLLACNLAAAADCIVTPEPLAKRLGLEVRHNLARMYASYAAGMRATWKGCRSKLNRHLCTVIHPDLAWVLGYDIQWRSVMFWVAGEEDGDKPGADPLAEREVMAEILGQMAPNIGMRGFPAHGRGMGMGELDGVRFCGAYGKALVCTNLTPNVSILSGVRIDRLKPPPQPPMPTLEREKVYIALTMSDGDNLNTFHHYFRRYFEHPAHGTFPIGWGMGPAVLDLMPGIAQWYYEHAKPGDEFLADVSGIAYIFPDTYASRYRNRDKVLDDFLGWTARYMQRLGMRTIRTHGGNREVLDRYARRIPSMHSIFADYARRGLPYERSVYALDDGTPVFHALTHWKYGKDGLLRDIREQVGRRRPAFVNAFLHNWTFDMDALARAVARRDADMVFVTPAQLAALYRQAHPRPRP